MTTFLLLFLLVGLAILRPAWFVGLLLGACVVLRFLFGIALYVIAFGAALIILRGL